MGTVSTKPFVTANRMRTCFSTASGTYWPCFKSSVMRARRAAQQQRELAVRDGLLRQIVIDDERVAAAVAIELGHRDAGVGREELQRRRLGRRRHDDRRVRHRAVLVQLVDDGGDRGLLLA